MVYYTICWFTLLFLYTIHQKQATLGQDLADHRPLAAKTRPTTGHCRPRLGRSPPTARPRPGKLRRSKVLPYGTPWRHRNSQPWLCISRLRMAGWLAAPLVPLVMLSLPPLNVTYPPLATLTPSRSLRYSLIPSITYKFHYLPFDKPKVHYHSSPFLLHTPL